MSYLRYTLMRKRCKACRVAEKGLTERALFEPPAVVVQLAPPLDLICLPFLQQLAFPFVVGPRPVVFLALDRQR